MGRAEDIAAKVRTLLSAKSAESATLEYKQASYDRNDAGRREAAKDISGFANRSGGILLIGVAETDSGPTVEGLDPAKIDQEIQWLESICRSLIVPFPVGTFVTQVEIDGRQIVAIDVRRGVEVLHEVPTASGRFFVREEKSVRSMSRDEIRFAVREEANLSDKIAKFCDDLWEDFITFDKWDGEKTEGCQLVIFPIFDGSFTHRINVPEFVTSERYIRSFTGRNVASPRPRIDGLEFRFSNPAPRDPGEFAKFFNHGAVQIVDQSVFGRHAPGVVPGSLLMSGLIGSIRRAATIISEVTSADQFIVDFRVQSQAGLGVALFPGGENPGYVVQEEMIFDPVFLNSAADKDADVAKSMKSMLDQIWQSIGFLSCAYFNEEGVYSPPR